VEAYQAAAKDTEPKRGLGSRQALIRAQAGTRGPAEHRGYLLIFEGAESGWWPWLSAGVTAAAMVHACAADRDTITPTAAESYW